MSGLALAALIVVGGGAAMVTTVAGFGFSLMSVPLLAAPAGPREAVAVTSLLGVLSTFVHTVGACLPALLVGWCCGLRLHRHVDAGRMRPLVLVLLSASAGAAFVAG